MSSGSGLGVEIRGAAETGQMFESLSDAGATRATHRFLQLGGQMVVRAWKLRLSGPAGPRQLGIGTGTLRRSVQAGRVQMGRRGGSVPVGTNQPYAAAHEYGFRGNVQVRSHLRTRGGATFPVSAHVRQMRLPERPHLRPALKDATPALQRLYRGEIDRAIRDAARAADHQKGRGWSALSRIRSAGGTGRRTR